MANKKPLSEKQILNRLQKKVDQLFTKTEQDKIKWGVDTETSTYYSWHLEHKGHKLELACDKKTGIITTCGVK